MFMRVLKSNRKDDLKNVCLALDDVVYGSRFHFYIAYTIFFIAYFLLFSASCWLRGQSFIWWVDGLEQQYPFFILEGRWIRELLYNIFIVRSFEVPEWSSLVGYGADYFDSIINTVGNPINLISVFSDTYNAELLLNSTVPITLYLAGLFFLVYSRYRQYDCGSSLIGSFVFIFSGFSAIAFQQIYMIYPLALAPLALLGIDKALDSKGSLLLTLAVTLTCMYSVTTAYILCLVLIVYCLVRFIFFEDRSLKALISVFIRCAIPVVIGILCAGILFIPAVANVLTQSRSNVTRDIGIVYSMKYYVSTIRGLFSVASVGADCFIGFSPVGAIAILTMIKNRGENYRFPLLILFIFILILLSPLAGSISNGFSYSNNRWVWSFSLFVGVVVAAVLPELWERNQSVSFAKLAFPVALVLIFLAPKSGSFCALFFSIACMTLAYFLALSYVNRSRIVLILNSGLTLAVYIALVFFYVGTSMRGDRVSIGAAYSSAIVDRGYSLLEDATDANKWSTDSYATGTLRNSNLIIGVKDNTFYNSFYNSFIDEYHTSLGLVTSSMNYSYCTLNSRTALELLAGTKYFITGGVENTMTPPIYNNLVSRDENGFRLYSTDSLFPMAYYVSSIISESDYYELSFVDRQNVLAQGLVLQDGHSADTANAGAFGNGIYSDQTDEISYEFSTVYKDAYGDLPICTSDNAGSVMIEGNTVTVSSPGSILYLVADIPDNCEAYVSFHDLRNLDSDYSNEGDEFKVYVCGENMEQEIWCPTKGSALDGGKDSWCVNTGYSLHNRSAIALRFEEAGVYTFSSLSLTAERLDWISNTVTEHEDNSARDILYSGNELSCNYYANEDGYLFIRLPYSSGWAATNNNESIDVLKANVGFMAVRVRAGDNHITLRYRNPVLACGVATSVAGACCLVLWNGYERSSRNKRIQKNDAMITR